MKKTTLRYLAAMLFLAAACSSESTPENIVTRVNDFYLTQEEFQTQLAMELELDDDFKLTRETREQFLEELIRKELLIQEAKRRKLDQEKRFTQTIERYWESTLIRNLLDQKSREVSRRATVSEEEIQERYNQMKQQDAPLPELPAIAAQIRSRLKEEKKSRLLKKWVDSLRSRASIKIYPSRL